MLWNDLESCEPQLRREALEYWELLNLIQARESLTEFCRQCGFNPARHHQLIVNALEDVAAGRCDKLALFLPPGSAKSTYASVLFPPWFLSRHKGAAIIAASHTVELAERWGRRVRNLVTEHGETLLLSLSDDNKAAGRWETTQGGEYYAAGVGGSITGRRADLAIIDDPIRSREDADSDTVRDKQWEWYKFDLRTRLKPGAKQVLIQTRWHEDDLAGRILNEEGDRWRVISLPMEAEGLDDPLGRQPGEPLWPEWFDDQMRADAKRDARLWSALYQQRPAPEDGDYWKADWFKPVAKLPDPKTLNVYMGSDYATTSDGGDYTVHAVVGVDPEDRIYILDVWRKQASSDVWVDAFCDLVLHHKPMACAEEQGQIRAGVGPFLTQRQRQRKAWVAREQFPTRGGDKGVRAQSFRGRAALNGIYYQAGAAWWPDLRAELLSFPAGKHDDQHDALGLVGQLLDRMQAGRSQTKKVDPLRDRYDRRRERDEEADGSWKTA